MEEQHEGYVIHLDAFEGPMDLLMHLIEKNKLDIYDIPIAELTEQYLAFLDGEETLDMERASSFLLMAATLLRIKSRMMLPKPAKAEEEDDDPRLELVLRILEYRKFKEASEELAKLGEEQGQYVKRSPLKIPVRRLPPANIPLEVLLQAFNTVLAVKEELKIPHVLIEPEAYSVEGKMEELLVLLKKEGGKILFFEAFSTGGRGEIIVTFLALLELIRLSSVVVTQRELFADIFIESVKGE